MKCSETSYVFTVNQRGVKAPSPEGLVILMGCFVSEGPATERPAPH